MSARSDMERATAAALGEAFQNSFGPCACHMTGMGTERQCAMHKFISEVDKRSVPIPRIQRLLFVRALRERLQREEGLTPVQPSPPVERLSW